MPFEPKITKEQLTEWYLVEKIGKEEIQKRMKMSRYALDKHLAHYGMLQTRKAKSKNHSAVGKDKTTCLKCDREFMSEDKRKFRLCPKCRYVNYREAFGGNQEGFNYFVNR